MTSAVRTRPPVITGVKACLLLVGTSWTCTGLAAELTDVAPVRGASVRLAYDGELTSGALEEEGERISGRQVLRHDLLWRAEVSPARGLAVNVGLEHSPSLTFSYPDARPMIFEPTTGAGTYRFSRSGPDVSVKASGVSGVWLGAALLPYSEAYERQQQATWRIDVGLRPGSPQRNLWTAKNGKRGPAPGGTALRLATAFSKDLGTGNPYMGFAYLREGSVTVDLEDEEGIVHGNAVELRPASTLEATGGVEIVAWQDSSNGRRVAVDLSLTGGYRTWQDVGSGLLLPNVLDGSRGIPVTSGEVVYARTGLGADVHFSSELWTRTGLWAGWETPSRPEHVYSVTTTTDTFTVGWFLTIEGRAPFGALFGASSQEPPAEPQG